MKSNFAQLVFSLSFRSCGPSRRKLSIIRTEMFSTEGNRLSERAKESPLIISISSLSNTSCAAKYIAHSEDIFEIHSKEINK